MIVPSQTEDLQRQMTKNDSFDEKQRIQQLDQLLKQKDNEDEQNMKLEKDNEPPEPPDGGWGWIVILAASVAFFVAGGFGRSFTLIYQELITMFGQSATSTASVAALFGAVKLCSSKY